MRSNRILVGLLLLIIALAGVAIVRRRQQMAGEQEAMPSPRVSPAAPHSRYLAILEEYLEADRLVAEAIRSVPAERKGDELLRARNCGEPTPLGSSPWPATPPRTPPPAMPSSMP